MKYHVTQVYSFDINYKIPQASDKFDSGQVGFGSVIKT